MELHGKAAKSYERQWICKEEHRAAELLRDASTSKGMG